MKKWLKIKICILVVAFFAMSIGTFLTLYYSPMEPSRTTMKSAALPVIYMQTPGGCLTNPASGYLNEVNGKSIFNGITALDENRTVTVAIYQYSERVTGISYRVVDFETGKLLEDTEVPFEPVSNKEVIRATFNINNLIEKNQQYLLEICLSTLEYDKVSYYERILWADNLNVDEKIEYTLQFNADTYNAEKLSEITQWIETDGTGDNTNYGHVGIHSTAEQIGWGALQPKVEGNIIPTVLEITDSVAQIALTYKVATPCAGLTYDSYSVQEYFRIRQSKGEMYLLSYDRCANQRFDGNEDLQASGRINLGIKEGNIECEAMSDEKGRYSFFVDSGQLWCYARAENKFTNVFTFEMMDDSGMRNGRREYDIQLISVDETGMAYFLVAGYMSRGEHEGRTGISLYCYQYTDNKVQEQLFIPVNMTYDEMKDEVGDVVYLSGDQLYLKVGDTLYSVDLISREKMVVTDRLYPGTYSVTGDGTRMAYHYTHTEDDETQIRIIDFTLGTEQLVQVQDYGNNNSHDRIRLIGYIEKDFVFGVFDERDVTVIDGVNKVLPMYEIYILDPDYEMVKDYHIDGTYVTQAVIEGMRVNLTRLVKNEEGEFAPAAIDQLMNRKENNEKSGMYTEIVVTKDRQKEIYLYLSSTAGNTEQVSLRYAREVVYNEDSLLELDDKPARQNQYYAYGFGKTIGVYDELSQAVKAALTREGFVLDSQGNCLWHRTRRNNKIVWNDMYAALSVSDFPENLTGLSLDNILYFVSDGKFVMARNGRTDFALIYDYDNTYLYYYDLEQEKLVEQSMDDAEKLFIEWGNVFLTTK